MPIDAPCARFGPPGRQSARRSGRASLGDAVMAEALMEISGKSFGVTGVTDTTGKLTGIITNGDLSRHMEGLMSLKARDVMTRNPITIDPDALAERAVGVMNERKITSLLVVDPKTPDFPVGLLHIHDCLRVGLG